MSLNNAPTIINEEQATIHNLETKMEVLAKEVKELRQTVLRLSLLQKKAQKSRDMPPPPPPMAKPPAVPSNVVLRTPSPAPTKQDTTKTQRTRTQQNKARALVFKQQVSFGFLKGKTYGRVVNRMAHHTKVFRYLNWAVKELPPNDKFVMFLASQGFPKTTL
tara:strand:+ start:1798 stop:2283 length:486 start_codon:yes stop_codon:yes gene_type:complete